MLEKKDITLEKAVLIGVITKEQDESKSKEYLDELEFLTYTAGGEVVKRFTQKMDMPNPKTFIGSGKMNDVQEFINENEVEKYYEIKLNYNEDSGFDLYCPKDIEIKGLTFSNKIHLGIKLNLYYLEETKEEITFNEVNNTDEKRDLMGTDDSLDDRGLPIDELPLED